MKTLYDALKAYSGELSSSDYAQLKTALVRYVVPGWGGPKPKGARSSSSELEAGIKYTKSVTVEKLGEASETQEAIFNELKASKTSRRNYRHHLKQFINWAERQGFLSKQEEAIDKIDEPNFRFRDGENPAETPTEYRKRMGISRVKGKTFRLKDMGSTLEEQFEQYREYRLATVREITVYNDIQGLRRYLGWLAQDKQLPESSMTIHHAIPFIKLCYDEHDFADHPDPFSQAAMAEKKGLKKADLAAQEVAENVERYRTLASNMCYRSGKRLLVMLMNFTRWIYRNETRANFTDISFITRLRELKKNYAEAAKDEAPAVPYSLKSADWSEIPTVLRYLKQFADAPKTYRGDPRSKYSIGGDIQRLLVLSLLVAGPPRRNRVFAELELGRTLQKGKVAPKAGFVPESQMSPHEKVKWCVTLGPKDYKTGRVYGPQSFQINNIPYGDGTTLYDYLDKWINIYRPLFEPYHKRLFVRVRSRGKNPIGSIISGETIRMIVSNATLKALGKPISPKEFRKMFVSHISNRPDMSEADMEAVAKAMGHSRKMQMSVYDQVTAEARLATAMDLSTRLWQEIS